MLEIIHRKKRLSSFKLIAQGFAGVIVLGALILMLPFSSNTGSVTPFHEALFTSTSAVCVTGLVVQDTGSYWSAFGQAVILLLIQIGGLGVVTVAATFAMLSGRKISLMQRSTMQDAISAPKVGGIDRLPRFIVRGTIQSELIGMEAMLPEFCNAGLDLLGTTENKYPSLTGYVGEPTINIVIMILIIVGGIGFLTWDDICTNRWHFKKYRMQSKVILVTSVILIIVPAIFFFLFDFTGLPPGEKILASLFQSVTPRTAGFNTADLTAMTESSKANMILLMLVGGSPGSTAGGIKTTTLAVLILNAFSVCRKKNDTEVYGRRLECSAVKSASTIAVIYFLLFFIGGIIISTAEGMPLSACLYETASAVGTVGLTLGVTPQLSVFSQFILIVLMYLGRVGGLTLIYAAISNKNQSGAKLPLEKITVG